MPAPVPIADHPDQITPDWLGAVFAHAGIDAQPTAVAASPVGTGQMADNYRLSLSYASKSADAPDSVVVKVPSQNETSRASGASGAYVTEVRFYTELADDLAIRTPRCLHGAISDSHDSFVLVLEDLAPAVQGDQIRGCSPEQAQLALENLAGLHGSRWCAPSLDDAPWLSRATPDVARMFSLVLAERTGGFIERYRERLAPEDQAILRDFAARCEAWLAGRTKRFAPVHGDYRLDNLLFGTAAGGAPIAAVDWQTLSIGQPGRDVGYFLGNAMPPEARRAHERDLVAAYHRALEARGVRDYGFDECFEDYRYGQFQGPLVTVLGAMSVVQTERGDDMFMAMAHRCCAAIRELESQTLL